MVDKDTAQSYRAKDPMLANKLFGEKLRKGVNVLYLEGHGVQPHAIAVDCQNCLIYDNAQPAALRLSPQDLALVWASGNGASRIMAARKIMAFKNRSKN